MTLVKTINDVTEKKNLGYSTEVPPHFLYSYRSSKKALGSPPLITIVPRKLLSVTSLTVFTVLTLVTAEQALINRW